MSGSDVARSFYTKVGAGDLDGAMALYGPGAVHTSPGGEMAVPDGLRMMLQGYLTAFPGFKIDVTRVIESDDNVAVEGVWTGTNSGPMMMPDGSSMPPTGKTVTAPFASLFAVHDGKITAQREYWDMAGFMGQLQ